MVIKFYILWWSFALNWWTKASKHTYTTRKSTSINGSGTKANIAKDHQKQSTEF